MNCEIEFLPVGEASNAGDAIVVRYGYEHDYRLMLVDGGHQETATQIIEHLRSNFGPHARLEHVVLTHGDADHASGLRGVLEEIEVANLWLHRPWAEAAQVPGLFADKRWTPGGLQQRIRGDYAILSEIVQLAEGAGTTINDPYQGAQIGPFTVLSPSRWAYQRLVPQFDKTPDPDQEAIEAERMWIGKASLASRLMEQARTAVQSWTTETWEAERLRDGGVTSASNESSVILYGLFDVGRALLTGDAGINGLSWAANYATSTQIPLQDFKFVQIPHHGSRRNVGPTILNQLLGRPVPRGTPERFDAFVSAPADDAKHPRLVVLNAFTRRGAGILKTQGRKACWPGGFATRPGYDQAPSLPFYTQVEEYS